MKTLHVLGLPHTVTAKDSLCETTQKIFRFCKMFANHPEYRVVHYGHNKSSASAVEQVNVTSDEVLSSTYGSSLETENKEYYDLAHRVFRSNATREIRARKQKGDFLLAFNLDAKGVADEVNVDGDMLVVETSVNYAEAFSLFRCYESYPLKAAYTGTEGMSKKEPRWYWRVVPASFDVSEYKSQPKEHWAVCVGESETFCGLRQVVDVCGRAGIKLKLCVVAEPKDLDFTEWPAHVECLGTTSKEQRLELFSRAFFGFSLNALWEAFNTDVVEMLLSGCIPITMDAGALTEYVVDGVNGFRCNTVGDIACAIKNISTVDRNKMRNFAQTNFSLNGAKKKYERAFADFSDVVHGKGWFEEHSRAWITGLGLDYKPLYV